MKQTTKILTLGLIPAMLLCGCAKKCTFEEFVKAVDEIKEPEGELESVTIKGKVSLNGNDYSINKKFTEETKDVSEVEEVAFTLMVTTEVFAYSKLENKNATYYAGSSFKYETEDLKLAFNKYGLCTKYEGGYNVILVNYTVDLSASYSFASK